MGINETVPAMVERLRAELTAMHRRAQTAEGIIAQAGLVEGRPQRAEGRSLGRALANLSADQYRERAEAAEAEVERLTQEKDLRGAQLLAVASALCGDPKMSAQDRGDPRWTPALLEVERLTRERDVLRAQAPPAGNPDSVSFWYVRTEKERLAREAAEKREAVLREALGAAANSLGAITRWNDIAEDVSNLKAYALNRALVARAALSSTGGAEPVGDTCCDGDGDPDHPAHEEKCPTRRAKPVRAEGVERCDTCAKDSASVLTLCDECATLDVDRALEAEQERSKAELERAVAAEREACAKACETILAGSPLCSDQMARTLAHVSGCFAAAIRARSEPATTEKKP